MSHTVKNLDVRNFQDDESSRHVSQCYMGIGSRIFYDHKKNSRCYKHWLTFQHFVKPSELSIWIENNCSLQWCKIHRILAYYLVKTWYQAECHFRIPMNRHGFDRFQVREESKYSENIRKRWPPWVIKMDKIMATLRINKCQRVTLDYFQKFIKTQESIILDWNSFKTIINSK